MSSLTLHDGRRLVNVHPEGTCIGWNCAIHNPSDHPLNTAPFDWYADFGHLVRVCEHGFHHPDPDDIAFKRLTGDFITIEAICSVHLMRERCDGCCQKRAE